MKRNINKKGIIFISLILFFYAYEIYSIPNDDVFNQNTMLQIADIKSHGGENFIKRWSSKNEKLYKYLLECNEENRGLRIKTLSLKYAEKAKKLFQEKLLPFHINEGTQERLDRSYRILNKEAKFIDNIIQQLHEIDIRKVHSQSFRPLVNLYEILHKRASFPGEEPPFYIEKLSHYVFTSAFLFLVVVDRCLKRIEQWDNRDKRSFSQKLLEALKNKFNFKKNVPILSAS